MNIIKKMQIAGKFKKGRIVSVDEVPDRQDRDEFLVEYSAKNNIPIVISVQDRFSDLKYINISIDIIRLAQNFTIELKEADTSNGILIDETVSIEMITWIKEQGIKICGGFS